MMRRLRFGADLGVPGSRIGYRFSHTTQNVPWMIKDKDWEEKDTLRTPGSSTHTMYRSYRTLACSITHPLPTYSNKNALHQ